MLPTFFTANALFLRRNEQNQGAFFVCMLTIKQVVILKVMRKTGIVLLAFVLRFSTP